jgi:hypothetical protein
MVIEFMGYLLDRTTNNYNTIVDFHPLKITAANTLRVLSLLLDVSWERLLTIKILQFLCSRRYCPENIPQLNCFSTVNSTTAIHGNDAALQFTRSRYLFLYAIYKQEKGIIHV